MLRAARSSAFVLAVLLGGTFAVACLSPAIAASISGSVRAPSDHDPALAVHAWSATTGKRYSTTKASGQQTYAIEVPPGRYVVFAVPSDPGAPPLYAGHTRFTLCARDVAQLQAGACQDHALVEVEVGRRKVTGVDVTDWFLDGPTVADLARALDRPGDSWTEAELAAPKFTEYPAPRFDAASVAGAARGEAAPAATEAAPALPPASAPATAVASAAALAVPAATGPVAAPAAPNATATSSPAGASAAAPAATSGAPTAAPTAATPVATPVGLVLTTADPTDPRLERDRPALLAALATPPNFAGRFALVRVPCAEGAPEGCNGAAIVDVANGRVAYPPALNPLPPTEACLDRGALQFRSDSRLLTLSGRDGDALVTRYFVWNADALTLRIVASLASEFAERCVRRD